MPDNRGINTETNKNIKLLAYEISAVLTYSLPKKLTKSLLLPLGNCVVVTAS